MVVRNLPNFILSFYCDWQEDLCGLGSSDALLSLRSFGSDGAGYVDHQCSDSSDL